jgi:hypothetical protein
VALIQGRDTQTAHIGVRARLVKYGDIFVAFVVYTGWARLCTWEKKALARAEKELQFSSAGAISRHFFFSSTRAAEPMGVTRQPFHLSPPASSP